MMTVNVSLLYLYALSGADGILDDNQSHLWPRGMKFYRENSRDQYAVYLYQLRDCLQTANHS